MVGGWRGVWWVGGVEVWESLQVYGCESRWAYIIQGGEGRHMRQDQGPKVRVLDGGVVRALYEERCEVGKLREA